MAAINVLFVACLMGIGMWLEAINGKDGFIDELLTPLPLGLAGLVWAIMEAHV